MLHVLPQMFKLGSYSSETRPELFSRIHTVIHSSLIDLIADTRSQLSCVTGMYSDVPL